MAKYKPTGEMVELLALNIAGAKIRFRDGREEVVPRNKVETLSPNLRPFSDQDKSAQSTVEPTWPTFLRQVARSHSPNVLDKTLAVGTLKDWGSEWAVEKTAMAESSGTLGGYLVPQQLSTVLLRSLAEKGFIYPRALVTDMTTKELLLPKVRTDSAVAGQSPFQGGVSFSWSTQEGGLITETEPSFAMDSMVAWSLQGFLAMSNPFLADAGPETEGLLVELLARGASWQAEYAFLQGTGAPNLMPLGMLNSAACLNVARTTSSQVKVDDIANMAAKMIPEGWKHAIWACTPSVLAQIAKIASFQVTQGANIGDGSAGSLMTRPLFVTEKLPTLGLTGDLMFFDPSMYVIGSRQEVVVDADPHSLFQNNQTLFRVWLRIGGMPWLNNEVTLADGTTASSIVALAA